MGTGGGRVTWRCPQPPSSSPSEPALTADWIGLEERERKTEIRSQRMSDKSERGRGSTRE